MMRCKRGNTAYMHNPECDCQQVRAPQVMPYVEQYLDDLDDLDVDNEATREDVRFWDAVDAAIDERRAERG